MAMCFLSWWEELHFLKAAQEDDWEKKIKLVVIMPKIHKKLIM